MLHAPSRCAETCITTRFVTVHKQTAVNHSSFCQRWRCTAAMKFDAELKHHILSQYSPRQRSSSLRALSRRYGLGSRGSTIAKWLRRWDGTAASLQERTRPGRPPTLTRRQVHNHIHQPVVAANRAHRCIDYPTVHRRLLDKTESRVSLRTVQRLGKERAHIKPLIPQRRSAPERKHVHSY